jgi:N-acetylmuramoyl-L-alanine amidase
MQTIRKGSRGGDVATLQHALNLIADGIFGPITDEAVRDFQRSHNLAVDGIVGPKTWAALGIGSSPNPRRIDKIILHCSATPEGEDYTVDQIRQMHLARGFTDIGYHWYITRDGKIHKGRDEAKIGAHTTGQNSHSIGVCYCGGCPPRSVRNWANQGKDTRTPEQRAAIIRLCKELKSRYPSATLHGHNELTCKRAQSEARFNYAECSRQCTECEFANKACPSFIVKNDTDLCAL